MPFEKILAAIDGSEASDRAFTKALELASLAGAALPRSPSKARCPPTPPPSAKSTK